MEGHTLYLQNPRSIVITFMHKTEWDEALRPKVANELHGCTWMIPLIAKEFLVS
jgi:hypothetical protein